MDPDWRPVQGCNPSEGGDWRALISAEARSRIVNWIVEKMKKHLPMSESDEQNEVPRIAALFEEKIHSVATSQADYLRKLSIKMLSMEREGQQAPGNAQVVPNQNNPGQG